MVDFGGKGILFELMDTVQVEEDISNMHNDKNGNLKNHLVSVDGNARVCDDRARPLTPRTMQGNLILSQEDTLNNEDKDLCVVGSSDGPKISSCKNVSIESTENNVDTKFRSQLSFNVSENGIGQSIASKNNTVTDPEKNVKPECQKNFNDICKESVSPIDVCAKELNITCKELLSMNISAPEEEEVILNPKELSSPLEFQSTTVVSLSSAKDKSDPKGMNEEDYAGVENVVRTKVFTNVLKSRDLCEIYEHKNDEHSELLDLTNIDHRKSDMQTFGNTSTSYLLQNDTELEPTSGIAKERLDIDGTFGVVSTVLAQGDAKIGPTTSYHNLSGGRHSSDVTHERADKSEEKGCQKSFGRKRKHSLPVSFKVRPKTQSCPWLRLGALSVPPCTNSPTSCAEFHAKTKACELDTLPSRLTLELINDDFVSSALQYTTLLMNRNFYPSVKVMRSIVNLILNIGKSDDLVSAEFNLRLLLELHPPCAPGMAEYYRAFLLESWKKDDGLISESILKDIVFKLTSEASRTDETPSPPPPPPPPVVPEPTYSEDENRWTLFGPEPRKPCYEDLSTSDRFRRLFIVFDFIVKVIESDFLVWLVKHGFKNDLRSILISRETRPLIVTAIWRTEDSTPIVGSVSRTCESLISLYARLLRSRGNKEVCLRSFHKMFAVIIEAMNAAEWPSDKKAVGYGKNCEQMANKLYKLVADEDPSVSDFSYMLRSLKPAWLPFYICDKQIRSKPHCKDSSLIAFMRTYVEYALERANESSDIEPEHIPPEPNLCGERANESSDIVPEHVLHEPNLCGLKEPTKKKRRTSQRSVNIRI